MRDKLKSQFGGSRAEFCTFVALTRHLINDMLLLFDPARHSSPFLDTEMDHRENLVIQAVPKPLEMALFVLTAVLLLLSASLVAADQTNATLLSEVGVLSIHVRDTNTHAEIFRFLTDTLRLPVDYYPETHGARKYAAVYAGNLFVEPCGPFSTDNFPAADSRALFFGLNCISDQSPAQIESQLANRKVPFEPVKAGTFRISDPLVTQNIHLGIASRAENKAGQEREAALRLASTANQEGTLGFEYVKEIRVGYAVAEELRAWERILGSPVAGDRTLRNLKRHQRLRFVRGGVHGLVGIVCKVRSLEAAENYLKQTKSHGRRFNGMVELDRASTCGLEIYLADQ